MHEIALRLAVRHFDKPIIENSFRSSLVEEMVAPFLALDAWRYVGDGWSGWDFERSDGARLEVKQSARHQTWSKLIDVKALSPRFDIAPRTGFFYNGGSRWTSSKGRPAHIYVFAWNGSYGEGTDHRDQNQWEFYVVPTSLLPAEQKTLVPLHRGFDGLKFNGGLGGPRARPESQCCARRPRSA